MCRFDDDAAPEIISITVVCEACGGEGRDLRGQYEDERDYGPCRYCDGGRVEVKTHPLSIEDLDQDEA